MHKFRGKSFHNVEAKEYMIKTTKYREISVEKKKYRLS